MNRAQVQEKIVSMMVEMFEVSPDAVTPQANLVDDLGLDSIDAIDMVVRLQELTGRRVNDASIKKVRTVGDVIDLVEDHIRTDAA